MTTPRDRDPTAAATPMLPFDPQQVTRLGIRVLPAEFARLIGTSKTSVSRWIQRGVITLGSDGRLDPREAVRQLLRNSDPARLRSKVLAPLVGEVGVLQRRVADLEAQLAAARADVEFHEGAAGELAGQVEALLRHFRDDWHELRALPVAAALAAIDAWAADLDAGLLDWDEVSILYLAEFPKPESPAEGEEESGGADVSRPRENEGSGVNASG